jgi:uncharacterized protein (DUF2235 family)
MRRIAVFLDGTWNVEDDNTNVWRLRSLCAPKSEDGTPQLIFYDEGLGTRFGEKVRGGFYGYGIDQNVRKPYQWLVENYQDGDEIFIFGFSRGAYTARSLAGLISICGLIVPGAPLGVGQLYTRYSRVDRNHRSIRELLQLKEAGSGQFDREETWLVKHSRPVDITMIGVWDTVGALNKRHAFLDPNLRKDMKHAFHALAIDEHRVKFKPTLWTQSTGMSKGLPHDLRPLSGVEQRWFSGAHANVGGGYADDPLPQPSLKWMMHNATSLGLRFKSDVDVDPDVYAAGVRDSYGEFGYGFYKRVFKPLYREIGAPPRESSDGWYVKTMNETIDGSVFDRWRQDASYRPRNVADWAKRVSVDPATITNSVRAADPNVAV